MGIQYEWLAQYLGIVTEPSSDAVYTIDGERFTDREQAADFLREYQRQLNGTKLDVAGTYFASSWRTVCAAMIYMIAITETRLDLMPANLVIQMDCGNGYPQLRFVLKSAAELPWPKQDSSEWRQDLIGQFYQSLQPIMSTIAAVTHLPLTQLWGQIPLGAEYYVNYMGGLLDDEQLREQLLADYNCLTKDIDSRWFGLKRNPFDMKEIWLDDPYQPGEQMRMKPTCCLAYQTGHGYCYGCPKLSKQDRQAKYEEIRTACSE